MALRKRFQHSVVAFILVLGLLAVPAFPAAADEVGSGWTQGIAEWISTWVPNWYSSTKPSADREVRGGVGSSQEALRPQPRAVPPGEHSDPDTRFLPPTVALNTSEEENCEAFPQQDPTGQC